MNTITETPAFTKLAEKLLGEASKDELYAFLAKEPEAGVVIEGTGGVRKLRWARPGMGKRGGVRVIYYFHCEQHPLLMIDLYAKGDKENLTDAEKNALAKFVGQYVASFKRRQK